MFFYVIFNHNLPKNYCLQVYYGVTSRIIWIRRVNAKRRDDQIRDTKWHRKGQYAIQREFYQTTLCWLGFFAEKRNSSHYLHFSFEHQGLNHPEFDFRAYNAFYVNIGIRFNNSIVLHYNFEPWTTSRSEADLQLQMIKVKVGDWVTKGSVIADFLSCNESAHVHFSLDKISGNTGNVCPQPHFSAGAYDEMMNLIHAYHADWEMCYP